MRATRLRTGVSWAEWHTPAGEDWYAWLLPRLAEEFDVLPCLHHTPPSRGVLPTVQSPPRRSRDYADFLDPFLDRFGGLFEWLELWNEPSNLNDWDWTRDSGWEAFCAMIGDAAHRARSRGKKTALGGMCPVDPNWLDLLGHRGVLGVVDAVGFHGSPGSWTTARHGWAAGAMTVRSVLDRHGSSAEIWVTEAGFSTWNHDELRQLGAIVEAVEAPVDRIYWYAAEDLAANRAACDGFHVDERHYHFGVADATGAPKLAARVLGEGGLAAARELGQIAGRRRPLGARPVTLVTGGAGFVGTNLAEALLVRGERVRVLDNLSRPGVERNLRWLLDRHAARLEFAPVDIRDRHAVAEAVHGVTSVFHLAGQVAVTTSLDDPRSDFDVNLGGTLSLLDELRRLPKPPPVLFASTNKVYGSLHDLSLERVHDRWSPVDPRLRDHGLDESRPLAFCTPYGCSKGAADQYVLDWSESYGIPSTVFRLSCTYGHHQHGNEDQGWVAHFLLRTLANEPLTIYGDGAQMRDVLFVDDLVRAMLVARDGIGDLAGEAFNVGGGPENTVSLIELMELIGDLHGALPESRRTEARLGDQRWYVSNTAKLRMATGWTPRVGVAEGVETLYRRLAPLEAATA